MKKDAWLSQDRKHRFTLTRIWDEDLPAFIVIGLNPSTADETEDDPTIRRCIGFAKREGCGRLLMLNLWSYRATDPRDLRRVSDHERAPAVNRENVRLAIGREMERRGAIVVCAWGTHGEFKQEAEALRKVLSSPLNFTECPKLMCLGMTAAGHPRHPLYLRSDAPLIAWEPASRDTSVSGSMR